MYTILSAAYANEDDTAIIAITKEAAAVLLSPSDPQWADAVAKATAYVPPPADPVQLRDAEFRLDTERQELLTKLTSATPAQIKAYVDAQVTSLASAKVLLAKMLLVMATIART
jgi:hypothetical protein